MKLSGDFNQTYAYKKLEGIIGTFVNNNLLDLMLANQETRRTKIEAEVAAATKDVDLSYWIFSDATDTELDEIKKYIGNELVIGALVFLRTRVDKIVASFQSPLQVTTPTPSEYKMATNHAQTVNNASRPLPKVLDQIYSQEAEHSKEASFSTDWLDRVVKD